MPVTLVTFFKVPVADLAAAERFYATVFDFRLQRRIRGGEGESEHDEAVMAAPGASGPACRLLLTRYVHRPAPVAGEWVIGLEVDDIEGTIAAAVEAGGAISKPLRHYPEHGIGVALITDPEGNVIELLTAAAPAGA